MNEKRIFIQISLSLEEKDKIKQMSDELHATMSQFCREAIFEYIRRFEHPESFQIDRLDQINPTLLKEINQKVEQSLQLQKNVLDRTNIMNEMNKSIEMLRQFSIATDSTIKNNIVAIFKKGKAFTPLEIMNQTGYNQGIVFSIITELHENKLIELTERGKWKWKA